jgi:hypothetical protein
LLDLLNEEDRLQEHHSKRLLAVLMQIRPAKLLLQRFHPRLERLRVALDRADVELSRAFGRSLVFNDVQHSH